MAKVARIEYFDDLDGKPISTDDLNHIEFEVKLPGRRPARYALDLRTVNVAKFEKAIAKYIDNATKVPTGSQPAASQASAATDSRERSRAARQWAIDNGLDVSSRGRVSREIFDAYDAATS